MLSGASIALAFSGASILGRTVDTSGSPLPGMEIRAQLMDGSITASATSAADGTYHIDSLPPETYWVHFSDPAGLHRLQLYPGTTDGHEATSFELGAGDTVTGIDATMTSCAALSGTMTDMYTHAPIAGASIDMLMWNGEEWASYYGMASTDASGHWVIPELGAGTYKVRFWWYGYLEQWFSGAAAEGSAQDISLSSTGSVVCDAAMDPGSHISGKVTNAAGDPLSDVEILVWHRTASGTWETFDSAYADPDDNGDYRTESLSPGLYKLQFNPYGEGGYLSEFFDGAADLSSATTLTVGSHEGTTIPDATLDQGGTLSGTVTDASSHEPVSGAWVRVSVLEDDGYWDNYDSTETDDEGMYEIDGLPTGSYLVRFTSESDDLAFQYYNGASSIASAALVPVTKGEKTTGIDATLGEAGTIEGTVTAAADGAPLEGIWAGVYTQNAEGGWEWLDDVATQEDGSFHYGGLAPGSYRVRFVDFHYDYAREYYRDSATRDGSALVTVTAGATTTLETATLDPAGSISGTIYDAGGTPIAGDAAAEVCELVNGEWTPTMTWWVDDDGTYSVRGLAAGTYKVHFIADENLGMAEQWYNGTASAATAQLLTVVAGEDVPGVDAFMRPAGPVRLKYAAGSCGHLSGVSSQTVSYGFNGTTVTAMANSGYRFVRWSDGGTRAARREIAPAADATLTAYFAKATSVSITSNVRSVRRRHAVVLSGHVSKNLASRTHVVVWAKRPGSSTWTKLSTRHSTKSHAWSYSYAPSTKGTWYFQARYAGTSKMAASTSSKRKITVK